MPVESKEVDTRPACMIATHAKLDADARREVLNALRQIEGAKTLLRMLLSR